MCKNVGCCPNYSRNEPNTCTSRIRYRVIVYALCAYSSPYAARGRTGLPAYHRHRTGALSLAYVVLKVDPPPGNKRNRIACPAASSRTACKTALVRQHDRASSPPAAAQNPGSCPCLDANLQ
eukprot:4610219-Prymnesium_polylepis.2